MPALNLLHAVLAAKPRAAERSAGLLVPGSQLRYNGLRGLGFRVEG